MAKSKEKKPRVYTKCLARANNASLWLAEDHVMQVTGGMSLNESYRRFYFRDLQAVTERQTNQGMTATVTSAIVLTLVVVFSGFIIGLGAENTTYGVISGLLGFVFVVVPLAGYISLHGRDVMVRFRTATQEVGITAIATEKTLAKVMNTIQPMIMAAQADIQAENLLERSVEKNGKLVERSSRRFTSVRSKATSTRPPNAPKGGFAAAGRPTASTEAAPSPAPSGREGFSPMPGAPSAPEPVVETPESGEIAAAEPDEAAWDFTEPDLSAPAPEPTASGSDDDIPPDGDGEPGRPAL